MKSAQTRRFSPPVDMLALYTFFLLHAPSSEPRIGEAATMIALGTVIVDELNKWFTEQTSTPVGSIILMVLVFLTRVTLDQWTARRRERKRKPPRSKADA